MTYSIMTDIPVRLLKLISIFITLTHVISAFELLQSLEGSIGRENFSYYKLSKTGDIRIELESIEGDADLFVSDENMNPSEENCRLYSVTYGIDVVDIPHTFSRPVAIGVYGHSYYETSKYQIRIYLSPPSDELTYEQLYEKFHKYQAPEDYDWQSSKNSYSRSKPQQPQYSDYDEEEESEGSVLWQILLTLLKVIFEVIL